MTEINSPAGVVQPKVVGATAGASTGAAVGIILNYAIESIFTIDLPPVVEGAVLIVVAAGLAFLGGWLPKLKV